MYHVTSTDNEYFKSTDRKQDDYNYYLTFDPDL